MANKWGEIEQKATPSAQEEARKQLEENYNRPWWRLRRRWDRLWTRLSTW